MLDMVWSNVVLRPRSFKAAYAMERTSYWKESESQWWNWSNIILIVTKFEIQIIIQQCNGSTFHFCWQFHQKVAKASKSLEVSQWRKEIRDWRKLRCDALAQQWKVPHGWVDDVSFGRWVRVKASVVWQTKSKCSLRIVNVSILDATGM